ncbi:MULTISPECIES: hypothetical protein [Acaryochloris]|uniref:Uncharacterized protein n=1 Tax=Acaryochloris marina (strain MBIC 11017) TaxID=329726 RepID=B0CBJ2_ACAM1|nr:MULTISPECIES: hypothetical protein [Acaryochloris]ABW29110.1 conserved hypothetical protein [Acaryochloris marina MBIC11017]KAI9133664.1 hypothetical protein ON05_010390 [Acaryochloris sp. CCMEE 5410]BDM78059.1 hypothetical protein AM10699_09290 [Acaryochloris marina MBIC10699]
MNLNQSQRFSAGLSVIRSWLTIAIVVVLFGSIGLGWVLKSLLVLFGLILVTPVVLFVGLRWWLGRNLIQGTCPSCGNPLTGLKNTQTTCPFCGQSVVVENANFQRPTEPGTIDVQAVDVTSQTIE